jgi:tetratricopeptide (TPR) repeat protein
VLLIATTRPAGRVVAGGLLAWAQTTELKLQPLSSRASEALLRSLLARDVGEELVERIVASADGNAFSLGMLARYVNRTGRSELPDTVLALVVARLESLKDDERALVRAASLFGRSFPVGAVAGVLRKDVATIERLIGGLSAEDLFTENSGGIYRFRHEMYARAAYEMIASASRKELHRQAAEVLIQRRAAPLDVAHQLRYAGMNDEAAEWYVRVADDTAHRLTGSRRLDEHSLEEDGEIEMNRAHAAIMHCHDDHLGVEWLLKGFAKAKAGSLPWWRGVPLAVALHQSGPAVAEIVGDALPRVATALLPSSREFIRDLPDIVWLFGSLGLGRVARGLLERVCAEIRPRNARDPLIELSYALLEYHGSGLLGDTERTLQAATLAALEVGERASALNGRLYLGLVQGFAGRLDEGIATLSDVIEFDEHSMITRSAKTCRAMLYGLAGRTQEGFRDLEAADGDAWLALFQNIQRFIILQGAGRYEQATAIARSVYDTFTGVPSVRVTAAVGLAELLLEQEDNAGALAVTDEGLGILASGDIGFASFHYRFLCLRARCLTGLGDPGADEALRLAFDRVSAEIEAQQGDIAREAFRNLPLVSWVLAHSDGTAAPKPRRLGPRDTLPQMRS